LYQFQGRYGEAEPLYVQALEILVNTLPENHPYIQSGLSNFMGLVQQAVAAGRVGELSDHPLTQAVLQKLRAGNGE
jgi:hypothetical protein